MHCLDCRTQATTHTAVGICRDCGAAVCEAHARVAVNEARRPSMLSTPYQPPARTVRCATCATARAA
ncbi:LSD1 subclass zinc finger protein [Streptomyces canus]|nr:LSD1 subclass zinc finger protein [Streptomyces canus]